MQDFRIARPGRARDRKPLLHSASAQHTGRQPVFICFHGRWL